MTKSSERLAKREEILRRFNSLEIGRAVAVELLAKTGLPAVWANNLLTTGKL